jgi:addiction module HigA family antidote
MFIIKRPPTTPGEILEVEFLKPLGLTQKQLADHIGCDVKVVNRIVNNKTSVTAEMAVKLASTFNTSPQFWLNAQQALDIYKAYKHIRTVPEPIVRTS